MQAFFERAALRAIVINRRSSIIPEERQQTSPLQCSRVYHYVSSPTRWCKYFDRHRCPVEKAENSYYPDVLIPVREVPIDNIQYHKSHERKMVKIQSILILNELEVLLAIRTDKNDYIQSFRTREVSFNGLLRDLFREQTYASCSAITFSNIQIRTFTVLHLLAMIFTFRITSKSPKIILGGLFAVESFVYSANLLFYHS